ncbi:uncharacterized protein LOC110270498 [Arachis ipaensis]|uniref:uncharacterized protein LOC110270498 n=1 Tax=Arachis ipaensis TaxID=130454 RepID=UPI000A2AF5FB|nr:uncharacterized protein LOC110270498 [Arachis ipaensis]
MLLHISNSVVRIGPNCPVGSENRECEKDRDPFSQRGSAISPSSPSSLEATTPVRHLPQPRSTSIEDSSRLLLLLLLVAYCLLLVSRHLRSPSSLLVPPSLQELVNYAIDKARTMLDDGNKEKKETDLLVEYLTEAKLVFYPIIAKTG